MPRNDYYKINGCKDGLKGREEGDGRSKQKQISSRGPAMPDNFLTGCGSSFPRQNLIRRSDVFCSAVGLLHLCLDKNVKSQEAGERGQKERG